jgi:hypothetical protein
MVCEWSSEYANSRNFSGLLCHSSERQKSDADRKNDREPDPPHEHLV